MFEKDDRPYLKLLDAEGNEVRVHADDLAAAYVEYPDGGERVTVVEFWTVKAEYVELQDGSVYQVRKIHADPVCWENVVRYMDERGHDLTRAPVETFRMS